MKLLATLIFAFRIISASSETTELDDYLSNLIPLKNMTNEEKMENLTMFLDNLYVSEDERELTLAFFESDLDTIAANQFILSIPNVRKALLKTYAENEMLLFRKPRMATEEKMKILKKYINITFSNEDVNDFVFTYFDQMFWWDNNRVNVPYRNPYNLVIREVFLPQTVIDVIYDVGSKANKMKKLEELLENPDELEKKLILKLYENMIDGFEEEISKHGMPTKVKEIALGETSSNKVDMSSTNVEEIDTDSPSAIYIKTMEILDDPEPNNQKKLKKFQQYAEGLSSRSTNNSEGGLIQPEELEHFMNFFNLTLTMNQTLDEVFANPVIRKKVLSVFIAQLSTNFSDFRSSDDTIPTNSRMESLPDIDKTIFEGLSPNETEILKQYFELYIEWNYVFQMEINDPFKRFLDTYNYTEIVFEYLEKEDFPLEKEIDEIREMFKAKPWVDEEELELIIEWFSGRLEQVSHIMSSVQSAIENHYNNEADDNNSTIIEIMENDESLNSQ